MLTGVPAQVGVAVIVDGTDTVTVNNSADYPMMSMFKLQEAIAVCRTLGERGQSIDTVFNIPRRRPTASSAASLPTDAATR